MGIIRDYIGAKVVGREVRKTLRDWKSTKELNQVAKEGREDEEENSQAGDENGEDEEAEE